MQSNYHLLGAINLPKSIKRIIMCRRIRSELLRYCFVNFVIFFLIAVILFMPSASASYGHFYAVGILARNNPYPAGNEANMKITNPTIIAECVMSWSLVCQPDGNFLAIGWFKGWGDNNQYYSTPTYVTETVKPLTPYHWHYFGSAPINTYHKFEVQWGRGTAYDWIALLDWTIKLTESGYLYWYGSAQAFVESLDNRNTMTGDSKDMKWGYPYGIGGMLWYAWDGYKAGYPRADSPYWIVTVSNTQFYWKTS